MDLKLLNIKATALRRTGSEKDAGKIDGQRGASASPQSHRVSSFAFPSSGLSLLSERLEQATRPLVSDTDCGLGIRSGLSLKLAVKRIKSRQERYFFSFVPRVQKIVFYSFIYFNYKQFEKLCVAVYNAKMR